MQKHDILVQSEIKSTFRVEQLRSIFDVSGDKISQVHLEIEDRLNEKDWNIGLIVGSSGSGKTLTANKLFKDFFNVETFSWKKDISVIDNFDEKLGIKLITENLSKVGFSSPANWLRPFHVLSNGEKFRVILARALSEKDVFIVDEFTSVVDRDIAKISCAAIEKGIRRTTKKMVAVSCHFDIIDWLQPDWIIELPKGNFTWRLLRPRPSIELKIYKCKLEAWEMFKKYHYLASNICLRAKNNCFIAYYNNVPVAFCSVISRPLCNKNMYYSEHRTVVLPDYQGVGIGNKLSDFVASLYSKRKEGIYFRSTTSNPQFIHARNKSKNWQLVSYGRIGGSLSMDTFLKKTSCGKRVTASFVYIGEENTMRVK